LEEDMASNVNSNTQLCALFLRYHVLLISLYFITDVWEIVLGSHFICPNRK
jgi:hypothetical protein